MNCAAIIDVRKGPYDRTRYLLNKGKYMIVKASGAIRVKRVANDKRDPAEVDFFQRGDG
jgi:hypothetical protein